MKEETKNEMDLLLRRLGRRDGATVPDTDHLDADELSAYAENALPAAARARYTAHLAECSRCRELVVQLSSAAGVVVATDTVSVSKPSVWRTFLASLFTPMVLRYAAPALGLIVVAAIGFVVLRRQQGSAKFDTQVAQNEQPAARPTAQPSGTSYDSITRAVSASSPEELQKQAANKPSPVYPSAPNSAPVVSSVDADVSKDKASDKAAQAQSKPEEQTASANEAPPPPKTEPTPVATTEARQKPADAEANKKEVRGLPTASAPTAARETRDERKREDKDDFARTPQAVDRVSGLRPGSASVAKLRNTGTRSVAGREFQKKGGVWIDTAYDSSKEVVSVTRGSEQYRGLVADEPAIKTIADELDGEIIVVWKGHTYRIR